MKNTKNDAPNPHHQPETEWAGEVQVFSSPALTPEESEPRERKGRPTEKQQQVTDDQRSPLQ